MTGIFRPMIFVLLLLLAWEAASRAGWWAPYLLPSPTEVGLSFLAGIEDRSLLVGAAASSRRLLIGYAVSLVAGTLLGLALGRVRLLQQTVGVLLMGLQSIPSICWLPLAVLWFGLSEAAILLVVIMGALLSITLATEAGVRNTPPLYVRAARTMGAKGARAYVAVILPSALPAILSGMKQGWAFAWRSLMAGELLFVGLGLGHLLQVGRELHDMSLVLAVMLVIVIIGVFFDYVIFGPVERSVRARWGLAAR